MDRTRTLAGRMTGVVATVAIAGLLAGCGSSSSTPAATGVAPSEGTSASSAAPVAPTAASTEPFTIRVAFGSTGEAVDGIFTELKAAYEAKYPGRTVEIVVQEDDVYETIGLNNLLTSRNAPDVYFEWPGARLATKVADGYGADISAAVADPRFSSRLDPAAYVGMVMDGKTYMVPWSGDVTNVFWYNKAMFSENGWTPPTTWDEFIALCAASNAKGITPIIDGNKDKWPIGSIASHLAERTVGNDAYMAAVRGEQPMNSPEMVAAFGKLEQLAQNGCINKSVNALPDDQATAQFLLGKSAMIGIGSWLVSDQLTQAPNLELGYFNMPTFAGAGNPESVLGVSTGFVVNAKSEHIDAATDFLAMLVAPEATKRFAEEGLTPMTIDPFAGVKADPNTVALAKLLSSAPIKVTPGDNLDVQRAAEFYGAAAAVIGGLKTPQEALDAAQKRVEQLPKS
jgi:raffinose/stachyose/melibiose transport system substrate-binding protein